MGDGARAMSTGDGRKVGSVCSGWGEKVYIGAEELELDELLE